MVMASQWTNSLIGTLFQSSGWFYMWYCVNAGRKAVQELQTSKNTVVLNNTEVGRKKCLRQIFMSLVLFASSLIVLVLALVIGSDVESNFLWIEIVSQLYPIPKPADTVVRNHSPQHRG